jgi:antitoxin StbD
MKTISANTTVSVSELKKNLSAIIKKADGEPIAVLNHNIPTAYLVPSDTYEELISKLEDYELGLLIKQREKEKHHAVEIKLNEL